MANELLKAQIEAALFLSEKPLKAQAVARIVNAEVNLVRQLIIELIHDYENRGGGLEVADDDGYIIQVKDEYTNLVDEFVPIDMPTALIRTLSAIAIKQPVAQSEVIKLRGAGAYDHIKDLIERELIQKREEGGRSPILSTTKKFQEYFRLSKDGKSFRQELSGTAKGARETDGSVDIAAGLEGLERAAVAVETVSVEARADTVFVAAAEAPASGEPVPTEQPIVAEEKDEVSIDLNEALVESAGTVFDASPDPGTPPIGVPGVEESEDVTADDVASITADAGSTESGDTIVPDTTKAETVTTAE